MNNEFTNVDFANLKVLLSRLSPRAHDEQEILIGLVNKIEKQLAKGNSNGTSASNKSKH